MFAAAKRVIVIGDVHGDIERVFACLRAAQVLNDSNEWVAQPPDTFVVQMGDQLDSKNREVGYPNWESVPDLVLLNLMNELDDLAKPHGGRVLSLLGNHEIMNIFGDFSYVSPFSMMQTGGIPSARSDLIRTNFINEILKRYVILKIGNLLFCHAGLLPEHLNLIGENIDKLNQVFRDKMCGNQIDPISEKILNDVVFSTSGLLWTRKYAEMASSPVGSIALDACLSIVLRTTRCTTMFIGHNTLENVSIMSNGGLIFTDACFSRAYGKQKFQYIDINNGILNIVELREKVGEDNGSKNDIKKEQYDSMI